MALNIPLQRLNNQRIGRQKFERPDQAVAWIGAMQAQDYSSVKWAIGLRCQDATDEAVEGAFASRDILRTWLMRGTLQVVAAADVHWMLALLGPRLIANSARRYKQLGLDQATFSLSHETISKALGGGKRLTRAEMMGTLEEAGIAIDGQRGYHILHYLGLGGLICFGPVQGKTQTFVLLDEWAPPGKSMTRDEALAELAGRYFRGHGPATLADFIWWSGLVTAEARAGLEMANSRLRQGTIGGETYWLPEDDSLSAEPSPAARLLPAFDEYFLGYRGREAVIDPQFVKAVASGGVFRPMLMIDGQIVGTWKRTIKKDSLIITQNPFHALTGAENRAILAAGNQYGAFLGLPAEISA